MKIAVVDTYIHKWSGYGETCKKAVVIVYPTKLQFFVLERLHFWERDEKRQHSNAIHQCSVKELGKEKDIDEIVPQITSESLQALCGEVGMTQVLWSICPGEDTDFLISVIWHAYLEHRQKMSSNESIEFFPVSPVRHIHSGRY